MEAGRATQDAVAEGILKSISYSWLTPSPSPFYALGVLPEGEGINRSAHNIIMSSLGLPKDPDRYQIYRYWPVGHNNEHGKSSEYGQRCPGRRCDRAGCCC